MCRFFNNVKKYILIMYGNNHVWEYYLPEVRATLQQVKDMERQLGFEFPEDYKDFLLHANGWNCFY